jgi:hypothetical protein
MQEKYDVGFTNGKCSIAGPKNKKKIKAAFIGVYCQRELTKYEPKPVKTIQI